MFISKAMILCLAQSVALIMTQDSMDAVTVFQDHGEVWMSSDMIHLALTVDVDPFHTHCQMLKDNEEKMDAAFRLEGRSTFRETTRNELEDSCQTVMQWPRANGHLGRQKRQLGLLLGTVFGATAIYELVHLAQGQGDARIHKVETKLTRMAFDMAEMGDALIETVQNEENLMRLTEFRFLAMEFGRKVDKLTRGITALDRQQLTTDLVGVDQLEKIWPVLLQTASALRGELPVDFARQLYELPASYVLVDGEIHVFLHVSVVQRKMRLFKWQSMPLIMHGEEQTVTAMIRLPEEFLAIDMRGSNDHLLLNQEDWSECLRVGQRRLCRGTRIYATKLEDSCIGALYANNQAAVERQCQVEPFLGGWRAAMTDNNSLAVFSRGEMPLQMKCRNGTTVSKTIKGLVRLQMEAGCDVVSSSFVTPSRMTTTVDFSVTHRPSWKPQALWGNNSVDAVAVALDKMGKASGDLHGIIREAEEDDGRQRREIALATCVAVGVMIVVAIMAFLGWRFIRVRGRPAQIDVEQEQIEVLVRRSTEGFVGRACQHQIEMSLEHMVQKHPNVRIILYSQEPCFFV